MQFRQVGLIAKVELEFILTCAVNLKLCGCTFTWFPLDRDRIVKSCDPSKFELSARRLVRYYDKNLLGCKSELR